MSKGSKRRPSDIPEDQVAENWERIFRPTREERCPYCGKKGGHRATCRGHLSDPE